jgi:hypothetical protein
MAARSALLVTGVALTASLSGMGVASADPQGEEILIACDNGVTYHASINGNGPWSPAHDLASTQVLIPLALGEFHGTLTDQSGAVIDEFTDPATTKGSSGNHTRATTTSCSFTINSTFVDPKLGTLHFLGVGTVTAFVTPVR